MHHNKVFITGFFPDYLQEPLGAVQITGIGMDKDGAVSEAPGRINIDIGHIFYVQPSFLTAHLVPLFIKAMGRMYLAEGFHGQEKDQLKCRYLPSDFFTFQCSDKAFSVCHFFFPPVIILCLHRHRFLHKEPPGSPSSSPAWFRSPW